MITISISSVLFVCAITLTWLSGFVIGGYIATNKMNGGKQ